MEEENDQIIVPMFSINHHRLDPTGAVVGNGVVVQRSHKGQLPFADFTVHLRSDFIDILVKKLTQSGSILSTRLDEISGHQLYVAKSESESVFLLDTNRR